jgi:hypothetical protein
VGEQTPAIGSEVNMEASGEGTGCVATADAASAVGAVIRIVVATTTRAARPKFAIMMVLLATSGG